MSEKYNLAVSIDPSFNSKDKPLGLTFYVDSKFPTIDNEGILNVNKLKYSELDPAIPAGAQGATGDKGAQGATGDTPAFNSTEQSVTQLNVQTIKSRYRDGFAIIPDVYGGVTYHEPAKCRIYGTMHVNRLTTHYYDNFGRKYNSSSRDAWFTGSHGDKNNLIDILTESHSGLIVSGINVYLNKDKGIKPSISESIPRCELTVKDNDKCVFGVICYFGEKQYNNNKFRINSLGEGAIWVCNKNGNLEIGDYISSTTVTGYGQKQNDDILHNYTVAKITCDCVFSLQKIVKQKVKVIVNTISDYLETPIDIGSYVEPKEKTAVDYDLNGKLQYEDDLDESGNQILEYKFDTRFLNASGEMLTDETDYSTRLNKGEDVYIANFVGCTYHCG